MNLKEALNRVEQLQTSINLKDLRMEILEKENRRLKLSLEHRKRLHEETREDLKSVIDRLTLLIGLRDPALLKQMTAIRDRFDL